MSNLPQNSQPRIADGVGAYTNDGAGNFSWKDPVRKAGFISRVDNSISFNPGTLTISNAPTGTDFGFYVDGVLWTKTTTQTVTWSDVEGIWLFYYDATGTLRATNDTTLWLTCIESGCALLSAIYWDATNNAILRQLDERHGADRNRLWHLWAHQNLGCQWTSGAAITATLPDSDGSTTDSPKITIAAGVCADEDISVNAASQTNIPIFYLEGSGTASSDIVVSGASDSNYDGTYVYGGTEIVGGFTRAYYSKAGNTHHISADSTGFNYWCLYAGARTNPAYTAATYVRLQSAGVTGLYQDLFLTISALASPASSNTAPPWRMKTADAYPIVQSGATVSGGTYTGANALPAYNKDTAGTWSLTEVPNGAYFAVHYFETTDLTSEKYIGFLGQTYWMDLNAARVGAIKEMGTLKNLSSALIAEAVEIGTVLFRAVVDVASSIEGYDNATHAGVISFDPAQSIVYMDWRKNGLTRGRDADEMIKEYMDNPRTSLWAATDFLSTTTSTAALYAASPWWAGQSLSSGTITAQAGTAAHPGVLRLRSTSSATTGYNYLTMTNAFIISGLESSEFVFQTEGTPSGINNWMGWTASATVGATNRCAVLNIDVSGGVWRLQGRVYNGADRTAATAYAPANSTWYVGRVSFNAAATATEFELWNETKTTLLFRSRLAYVPDTAVGHGVIGMNTSASQQYCIAMDYMNLSMPKTLVR